MIFFWYDDNSSALRCGVQCRRQRFNFPRAPVLREVVSFWTLEHTFSPTSTVCVLFTNPTTTDPCFTASCAYSTWKIRPCGELFPVSSQQGASEGGQVEILQGDGVVVVVIPEHDGSEEKVKE